MSRVLISKRAALDTITMQRRPNCYHHHKKMLLQRISRSIRQQNPAAVAVTTVNKLQQQNLKELHSSSSVALHCRQCVSLSLITSKTTKGTPFMAHTSTRTFHTAASPSGTDSHVLLSTRWGKFTSQDDARRQVARLSAEERAHLEKAIEDIKKRSEEEQSQPPTWNQLKLCKTMICYIM